MKTEIIKLISQWPSLGSAGRRTHCDRGAAISSQGWMQGTRGMCNLRMVSWCRGQATPARYYLKSYCSPLGKAESGFM